MDGHFPCYLEDKASLSVCGVSGIPGKTVHRHYQTEADGGLCGSRGSRRHRRGFSGQYRDVTPGAYRYSDELI